jgi:hypothetical protein
MVSPSFGFLDSPDAEIIAVGFNLAKEYGAIGIGRQANFLQWGYGDPPSRMTEAGRRLFINCIHYIHRFDGRTPLVRRRAAARDSAVYVASVMARLHRLVTNRLTYISPPKCGEASGRGADVTSIPMFGPDPWLPFETPRMVQAPSNMPAPLSAEQKEFFLKTFAPDLYDRYHADPNGLAAYYKANRELIYWDGVFRVDEDLGSLGLASNRKVETLERLFELRRDPAHREIAQRLLDRYTDGHTTFDFLKGRDRIYFTDVGGYRFKVMPGEYLAVK